MFDTRTVGKKIAALRKEKNKTQMELADEMGVSYQAVSNWERGNSMPDISKLPQLSLILGCSVDEILGESKEAELVEHVIDGTQKEYMVEENPEVDTVAAVVPLIKPEQTKDMAEIVVESAHREDEREAEQETENQSKKEKKKRKKAVKALAAMAPFLEEKDLEEMIQQYGFQEDMRSLAAFAPFLSKEYLEKIAQNCELSGNLRDLGSLAPFLSSEAMDSIVERIIETGEVEECTGLYPFLSHEALKKLADYLMREQGPQSLQTLLPFL